MSAVSIPSRAIDKPWTIDDDDATRGNLLWAIANGRIPKHIARRLAWDGICWVFNGCKDRDGYGATHAGGSMQLAHRVVYEAVNGAIPVGHDLHHAECGRKHCVDPRHVVAIPHGAHSRLTRIGAGAKLSMQAAREIRRRHARGDIAITALAAEYGVGPTAIWSVLSGRTWREYESEGA
jgi:hypothetical protein